MSSINMILNSLIEMIFSIFDRVLLKTFWFNKTSQNITRQETKVHNKWRMGRIRSKSNKLYSFNFNSSNKI